MAKRTIQLTVNGTAVAITTEPLERLSTVLRDDLGLTGTKIGCEAGDCGACTVIIDGAAACACLVPVFQVEDRKVETVEGLAGDDLSARLQTALATRGGTQCGICTPGILMAAMAHLRENRAPDRRSVEDALGGVLCRCTGYRKIVDAVLAAVGPDPLTPPPDSPGLGQMVSVDSLDKVKGSLRFGADEWPEGALWMRVIRSPHARARFTFGDLDGFKDRHPGVVDIVTSADIPGVNRFGPFPQFLDQPYLAEGFVRFRGEAVALIVGEKVAVEGLATSDFPLCWELQDPLTSPEQSLAEGADRIHDFAAGNILKEGRLRRSTASSFGTAAFEAAGTFSTQFVEHAYIEPEAGYAVRHPDGRIEVFSSTQSPYADRDDTARALGVSAEMVRIRPSACGGGFGSKIDSNIQPLLALAAAKTGQAVRSAYHRPESMAATTKRHPSLTRATLTADAEGRFLCYRFDGTYDTGAYASFGPTVAGRAPNHAPGPYLWPSASVDARTVYTNNSIAGAFRGFGAPQATFALESLIDEVAAKSNIDRFDLRKRNVLRPGDATVTGQVLNEENGMLRCLEVLEGDWSRLNEWVAFRDEVDPDNRYGVGIACTLYGNGNTAVSNPSTIRLALNRDGTVTFFNGVVDIGQGSNTALLQILCQTLSIPAARVRVVHSDTDRTADAGKTSGSRQILVSGEATRRAAVKLRAKILRQMNVGEETLLTFGEGVIEADGTVLNLAAVIDEHPAQSEICFETEATFDPPTTSLDQNGQGTPFAAYTFGAVIVAVRVDTALGLITCEEVVAAFDAGRIVNLVQAEGQVQGAVAQGIGMALMEEYVPGRTENLHDYLIPTVGDIPPITVRFVEALSQHGPFGAKGLGEAPLIPTPAAIANAIRHAVGINVTSLPILPHKLIQPH